MCTKKKAEHEVSKALQSQQSVTIILQRDELREYLLCLRITHDVTAHGEITRLRRTLDIRNY
jgi:hypothetical protein